MEILALLIPSIVSVKIDRNNEKWDVFRYIEQYSIYLIDNLIITFFILVYLLQYNELTIEVFNSFPFFLKFLLIHTVIAIVVPRVKIILKKYISVTFSVKTERKLH